MIFFSDPGLAIFTFQTFETKVLYTGQKTFFEIGRYLWDTSYERFGTKETLNFFSKKDMHVITKFEIIQ